MVDIADRDAPERRFFANFRNTDAVEITRCFEANQAPTANAGPNRTVVTDDANALVTLDGSGSDPEDDSLTFSWAGPFGIVEGATPDVLLALGAHLLMLTVEDGFGGVTTREVVIGVEADCLADLVRANETLPGTQTLNATATLGPNLIVNADNIAVNAPTVSILADTTISGILSIGTRPACD